MAKGQAKGHNRGLLAQTMVEGLTVGVAGDRVGVSNWEKKRRTTVTEQ